MTHPTDTAFESEKLSPAGRTLILLRDKIMDTWKEAIRSIQSESRQISEPILMNSLPLFLDNLAEALSPEHPRGVATDRTNLAYEHGSERARLTNYEPENLIREFQVLRKVLLHQMRKEIELTREEREIIYSSVDQGIRESVASYTKAQTAFREQFIAALTHDIRNPLGAARMAVELIVMDPRDHEVPFLASKAFENIRRADRMIQDLLDATYAKSGARLTVTCSEFDMKNLIDEVVKDMRLNYGARFIVETISLKGQWGWDSLTRALENLISNAVKYGFQNSPITLRLTSERSQAILSVHNRGEPIPIEQHEEIFESFHRTFNDKTRRQQGWGVGLATVKAVAEGHGGTVIIDSSSERGTTFTLTLPLDARPFQEPDS